eukprot:TRINITY_DN2368_c0_g1_i2.p1 TRINITY_DN2368_c0_g1~~TRINITY_DN2368_c0_g1_i2.p1  ORF type:complete len:543 (-),score=195.30 TRINITY_DN2368_c0_g1_i2:398-2026(-)
MCRPPDIVSVGPALAARRVLQQQHQLPQQQSQQLFNQAVDAFSNDGFSQSADDWSTAGDQSLLSAGNWDLSELLAANQQALNQQQLLLQARYALQQNQNGASKKFMTAANPAAVLSASQAAKAPDVSTLEKFFARQQQQLNNSSWGFPQTAHQILPDVLQQQQPQQDHLHGGINVPYFSQSGAVNQNLNAGPFESGLKGAVDMAKLASADLELLAKAQMTSPNFPSSPLAVLQQMQMQETAGKGLLAQFEAELKTGNLTQAMVGRGIGMTGMGVEGMGNSGGVLFGHGLGAAGMLDGCDEDEVIDEKKIKRMISNRASAKRSRQRRQERLEELEMTSAKLRVEHAAAVRKLKDAQEQLQKYAADNMRLLQQLQELQGELGQRKNVKMEMEGCSGASMMGGNAHGVEVGQVKQGGMKRKLEDVEDGGSVNEDPKTSPCGSSSGTFNLMNTSSLSQHLSEVTGNHTGSSDEHLDSCAADALDEDSGGFIEIKGSSNGKVVASLAVELDGELLPTGSGPVDLAADDDEWFASLVQCLDSKQLLVM